MINFCLTEGHVAHSDIQCHCHRALCNRGYCGHFLTRTRAFEVRLTNAADNIVAEILDNLEPNVDGAVAAEEGTAGGNIMEAGLEGGPVEDVVRADAEAEELLTRQLFGDEDEEEEEEEEEQEGDVEVEYLSEEDEELASDARRIGLDAS